MATYTFVNGQRKQVFTYNPRVVVGGVVKKIIEGYTFINGQRYKIFGKWSFDHTQVYTADTAESLPLGRYKIVCRGAGGAGGKNGGTGTGGGTAGLGGAGEKGQLQEYTIDIQKPTIAQIRVGKGGTSVSNGGNGGNGGASGYGQQGYGAGQAGDGGSGGGAGLPSYVHIDMNNYIAVGGAGGGGGGGSGTNNSYFAVGAGGGGGGGYYRVSVINGLVEAESVKGKDGGHGGYDLWSGGQAGVEGNVTDFPDVTSGRSGGRGHSGWSYSDGQAGASGGGASGAGGDTDGGNDLGYGGSAGGGAAGSDVAGGGSGGITGSSGSSASNHYTQPIDTLEENQEYGVNSNYGIGGTSNQDGSQGFIIIQRLQEVPTPIPFTILNLGNIVLLPVEEYKDADYISGEVIEISDAGSINSNVSETNDAGLILNIAPADIDWILGSVTENVEDTYNCGNII